MTEKKSGVSRRKLLTGLVLGGVGASAAFGWWNIRYRNYYSGEELTPEEAHALATGGEITLIDIRRPDEWDLTGSGEGAKRLDMRRDDFITELEKLVAGNRNAPIALICARGVRSDRMSKRLTEAGFTRIIDVPEGMLGSGAGPGWLKRGLPIEKG